MCWTTYHEVRILMSVFVVLIVFLICRLFQRTVSKYLLWGYPQTIVRKYPSRRNVAIIYIETQLLNTQWDSNKTIKQLNYQTLLAFFFLFTFFCVAWSYWQHNHTSLTLNEWIPKKSFWVIFFIFYISTQSYKISSRVQSFTDKKAAGSRNLPRILIFFVFSPNKW